MALMGGFARIESYLMDRWSSVDHHRIVPYAVGEERIEEVSAAKGCDSGPNGPREQQACPHQILPGSAATLAVT
ncbi:hypothetical protein RJ639_026907 [Escallonia herrerae]|uniref:Uncharacterized protein n=1 Tax=Escallonia herrerae TaxID=1293975 RepID=A0AA88XEV8_9ASTE|nr:hypothetical protein RJ639_026907 [Escallonia herrerae]